MLHDSKRAVSSALMLISRSVKSGLQKLYLSQSRVASLSK